MNAKQLDFIASKLLYNIVALFGFLIIFCTGMYWGYTFHENEQYFNTEIKEIKFIEYINTKYTYNFIPNKNLKYSDELASRITTVTILLIILGIILLELGYKFSAKYKYKNSLKQRIINLYNAIKKQKINKGD